MAQTRSCDCCKTNDRPFQTPAIVGMLWRAIHGTEAPDARPDLQGGVPDVCMDCWGTLQWLVDKIWWNLPEGAIHSIANVKEILQAEWEAEIARIHETLTARIRTLESEVGSVGAENEALKAVAGIDEVRFVEVSDAIHS